MPDKAWKAFERTVSTFFNTVRNSLSGMNSKVTGSDSLHPLLFVECKYRAKSPIHNLYAETKEKAKKEKKVPILCLKQKGKDGFLVVCHSDDFFWDHISETLIPNMIYATKETDSQ